VPQPGVVQIVEHLRTEAAAQQAASVRASVPDVDRQQSLDGGPVSLDVLWSLTGPVVGGERRGRLIGFPTANVQVPVASLLPPDGIYAGLARSEQDPSLRWAAAISVGSNPTFDGISRTVEAHLLDFAGELYGQQLHLQAVHRLRGMSKFPDLQSLVDAITADVAATRALIDAKCPGALLGRSRNAPDVKSNQQPAACTAEAVQVIVP
jgi:FAD synthase